MELTFAVEALKSGWDQNCGFEIFFYRNEDLPFMLSRTVHALFCVTLAGNCIEHAFY